jgi:hypothetical protein
MGRNVLWIVWITSVVFLEFVAVNFIQVGSATQSHNTLPYVKFGYMCWSISLTPFAARKCGIDRDLSSFRHAHHGY